MDLITKFLDLQQSLVNLGFQDGELEQDAKSKAQLIIKSCSQQLNVARVSLWKFNDKRDRITCESLYCQKEDQFSDGLILKEDDFPFYFSSLNKCRVINADDAQNDDRTKEFSQGYLKPLNIMSMLDVPIFFKNSLYGIICIEHVDQKRQWDMAEISYAVSAADTISLIISQSAWLNEKQQMQYMERIDPLTNLENRLYFQSRINTYSSKIIENTRCAVVLIGIDGFTGINDRFSYSFANKVLCEVAHRLEKLENKLTFNLARVAGDVFALWLPDIRNKDSLNRFINKVQQALEKEIKTPTNEMIEISACMGVFISTLQKLADIDPIRKAEMAMLKAKESGVGNVCFYKPEWITQHQEALDLENDFIKALTNGQIVAFYQPIIEPLYQELGLCLEALVRWHHPKKGILTPYIILPLAKRLGLMKELGDVVLKQVCIDIKRFQQSNVKLKKVSVNISSEQLFSTNLIAHIKQCITQNNLTYNLLEFEIVEDLIAGDSTFLYSRLEELKALGIELSIDDFGTGYSSLARLKNLNVSKLKIDKSFVDSLPENEHDTCIVQSVIGLAKGMRLQLVAEGVETTEQAKWLIEQHCDYLQGYLFSKPIPVGDVASFYHESNVPNLLAQLIKSND